MGATCVASKLFTLLFLTCEKYKKTREMIAHSLI